MNQKVMRGLALIGVALFFGVQAATYSLGTLAKAGAGLFPLIVSGALAAIGLVMLVQSRFEAPEPMSFNPRNLLLVLAALVGFVLIAQHVAVILAIVYLVFVSTMAGSTYSVVRNVKISAALIAIALAFHKLLGLNLPLW